MGVYFGPVTSIRTTGLHPKLLSKANASTRAAAASAAGYSAGAGAASSSAGAGAGAGSAITRASAKVGSC